MVEPSSGGGEWCSHCTREVEGGVISMYLSAQAPSGVLRVSHHYNYSLGMGGSAENLAG